ncbi:MAG: CBS domain-containing protein [Alphaproteobacteria bacterium]|nr:CBS domain-containing protein [Alphaproteobacteria bacterium]
MPTPAIERIDSFPYRHRVRELMTSPVVSALPSATLGEAAQQMDAANVSSLLVMDGDRIAGIVTERDVLRTVGRQQGDALAIPIADLMATAVLTVPADAYLHVAIARMERNRIRHLPVTDRSGHVVGMLTARALLKQRTSSALMLGDEIESAKRPDDLAGIMARLPKLAEALLAEGVDARQAAGVISSVIRDMTARAAALAAAEVAAARGPSPARYAVLVLGSGGRGESLLAPDQDNAIVHDGDAAADGWLAALGARMCQILDAAGVPYCKGKVMASEPQWRQSMAGWAATVRRWVANAQGENLLNVDIFFDGVAVAGDRALADALMGDALDVASGAPLFLRMLAQQVGDKRPPIGMFGRIRTSGGRADLKIGGLLPIVAAARVLGLALGRRAVDTAARLNEARAAGLVSEADASALDEAHRVIMREVLAQQIDDIAVGRRPGTTVDPARLPSRRRDQLVEALRAAAPVLEMVNTALSGDAMARRRGFG